MANIPIFIPHAGCKNDCAFCNQRSITGQLTPPSFTEAGNIIKENLKTLKEMPQIAFFGGSFTGIGDELMEGYLKVAAKYVEEGKATGIRLSTRPDYIDEKILDTLKKYHVTNIELGAQSLDDEVLKGVNRGHDSACVKKASKLILDYGFTLGLQMMVGLPLDTYEKSIQTAEKIVALGAKETRIYPTVVLENTRLCDMYRSGEYTLMSFDEAIDTSADCYSIFFENNVKVLRIGLMNSEELKRSAVAGFYHEALGELVYSRVIRRKAIKEKCAEISYNKKFQSKVLGHKRGNITCFEKMGIPYKLTEDNTLTGVCVNGKYVLTF